MERPTSQLAQAAEPINTALKQHQSLVGDWDFAALTKDLHVWAERMIVEFKLDVSTPALAVDSLSRRRLGHFRIGRNAFGILGEIAIEKRHAQTSAYWRVLGTLLHELIHFWQECHGTPSRCNHHNKEFRAKAASLGLVVDRKGVTQYAPAPTAFLSLLKKYGVDAPVIPETQPTLTSGYKPKLHLYECQCRPPVKVRVGRSRFNAQCLDCGEKFELKE